MCELGDLDGEIEDPFGGDVIEYIETADRLFIALTQICDKLLEIQENQQSGE